MAHDLQAYAPRSGVNLTALLNRLTSICLRRRSSARRVETAGSTWEVMLLFLLSAFLNQAQTGLTDACHIDRRESQVDFSRLDFGEVEDVRNQRQKMIATLGNPPQRLILFVRQRTIHLFLQGFGEPEDGI